jgi:hypothetical protein
LGGTGEGCTTMSRLGDRSSRKTARGQHGQGKERRQEFLPSLGEAPEWMDS